MRPFALLRLPLSSSVAVNLCFSWALCGMQRRQHAVSRGRNSREVHDDVALFLFPSFSLLLCSRRSIELSLSLSFSLPLFLSGILALSFSARGPSELRAISRARRKSKNERGKETIEREGESAREGEERILSPGGGRFARETGRRSLSPSRRARKKPRRRRSKKKKNSLFPLSSFSTHSLTSLSPPTHPPDPHAT